MPRNKYTDALYTVLSEKLGKQWSDGIDVDAFADSVQTNPKYADAGFDVLSAEIEGLDKDKYYDAIGFQAKTDTDTETELAKDGTAEKAKPREFTQMWQQGESPLDRDVIEKNKLAEPTYTEEDKAKFEAIDANPRLLMGEDANTRKQYTEYKKQTVEKTELTPEEREISKQYLPALESALEEVDEQIAAKRPQASRPGGSVLGGTEVTGTEEKSDIDREISVLEQKKKIIKEAQRYFQAIDKGSRQNAIERTWQGLKTLDLGNVVSLGIKDMLQGIEVDNIKRKLEEQGVESLTQDEQDILVLDNIGKYAQQLADEDRAFAVGQGIAETVPFIMDMIATSGVGAGIRKGVFKASAGALKNRAARKVVANLSDATARSFLFPMTYEEFSRRTAPEVGFDEEMTPMVTKEGEDFGEALAKSVGVTGVEIFSEGAVGAGLSKVLNKATAKGVKVLKGTKVGQVYDAIDNAVKGSPVLNMAKINDPITEFGEEVFAGVVQPIITGEGSPLDFFEYENMVRTALITTIISGGMAAPSVPMGMMRNASINRGKGVYDSLSDENKLIFGEAVASEDLDEISSKIQAIHLNSLSEDSSVDDIKKANRNLADLNSYLSAIKKTQRDANKVKGASYQYGNRLFTDSEAFFKEVSSDINKGKAVPFVKVNSDDAAKQQLADMLGADITETVTPTEEVVAPTEVEPDVTEQVETEVVETETTEVVPEPTEVAPEVETAPEMAQPEAGVETIEPTRVISPESTKTSEYEKEEGLQETEVEETPAPEAVVEQPEQVVNKEFFEPYKKGDTFEYKGEPFIVSEKTDDGRVIIQPDFDHLLSLGLEGQTAYNTKLKEIRDSIASVKTEAPAKRVKKESHPYNEWLGRNADNPSRREQYVAFIEKWMANGVEFDDKTIKTYNRFKSQLEKQQQKPVEPTQPPVERVSREEGAITPTEEKGAVKPSEEKARKLPEEIRFIEEELPSKKPKKGEEVEIPDDLGEINVKPIPVKIKKNDTVSAIAPLTSKDSFMAPVGGVYHDAENQVLVATDSRVIIIIPEKIEGKSRTIDPKTNTEIEGKFPNYKVVIPNNEEKATVKISDIIDDVAGVARLNDFVKIPSDKIPVGIALGGEWSNHRFDAKKMLPLLKAFAETGTTDVIFEVGEVGRGTVIRDANNRNKYAVIMPIVQIGGNFKTINVSPKGAPKEQVKEVATKLEITPKSARDLLRVAEEVFGLKGEQAIQFASVADLMFKAMAKRRNIPAKDRYKSLPISFRKGYESELKDALQKLQETGDIARGAMQQLANGQYIIYALTDPNISTPLHELAHVFESYLTESELKAIESWSNTKRGTREFKEAFAVGFEDYLRDGVAPNDKVKAVFEKFKKWLTDIYKSTVGIPLNDDMRRIYDSIIEGKVPEVEEKAERTESDIMAELDDMFGSIRFQAGEVLFQTALTPSDFVNKLVDAAERLGKDVPSFVSDYLKEKGNPISGDIVNNVLKQRGHAKATTQPTQEAGREKRSERKKERGVHLRDDAKDRKEEVKPREEEGKKVSQFGKRFFMPDTNLPIETINEVNDKGIHLYTPKKIKEANQIADELVAATDTETLAYELATGAFKSMDLFALIGAKTLAKISDEIDAAKKAGKGYAHLVERQSRLLDQLTKATSSAGLLLRMLQSDAFTDVLAAATWAKQYVDTVINARDKQTASKWFKGKVDSTKKKVKKIRDNALDKALSTDTVKKAVRAAQDRIEGKVSEASKKRQSVLSKWEKAIEARRRAMFQATQRVKFAWTAEDLAFAKELVDTYIEDKIYNRNVILNKLRKVFDKFDIDISDTVLEGIIPNEVNGKSLDELFEQQEVDKAAERLAGRIFGEVVEKKKKDDPLAMMVNTLTAKFREREKKAVKEGKSDMEKIVDAIKNVSTYKEVWTEARDLAKKSVEEDNTLSEFDKAIAKQKIDQAYDMATDFTFTENQVRRVMREVIKAKKINLNDIIRAHVDVMAATRKSLVDHIVDMSGLDNSDAVVLAKAVESMFERELKDKATSFIASETKKMKDKIAGKVNTHIVKTEAEKLLDLIHIGAFRDAKFVDAYATIKGIPALSEDHVKKIEELAEEIRKVPSTTVKRMRKEDLLMYMTRIHGISLQAKLDNLWFGFVLSGLSTQQRNFYGAYGNVIGMLMVEGAADPALIPDIIRGAMRGQKWGWDKSKVILKTGKQFFESKVEAPSISEHAADKPISNIFRLVSYVFRFMAAIDQSAMSIGKEGVASAIANEMIREQDKVNRFKKLYDRKYRQRVNEAVRALLYISPERLADIRGLVEEEAAEYGYTEHEKTVREYEMIDEMRPLDLVEESIKESTRATGNIKSYGSVGWAISSMASLFMKVEPTATIRGKDVRVRLAKLIAVFTRIAANIAEFQISHSPFAFVHAVAKKRGVLLGRDNPYVREMTPREVNMAYVKGAISSLLWIGLMLISDPEDEDALIEITGKGPKNYGDRQELINNKWQPYSIKIGGRWIPYKYNLYGLLIAPLGWASDQKRYNPEAKDTPYWQLVLQGSRLVPSYLATATPFGGMTKFVSDFISDIEDEQGVNGLKRTFSNMAKGFYAPGLTRDLAKIYYYYMDDNGGYIMENNEFYSQFIDNTIFDILPWPEDDFPARDPWGMPMKNHHPYSEFGGRIENMRDEASEARDYHYAQGAGPIGMPNRNNTFFQVYVEGGEFTYGYKLSRNIKYHRFLWNEVFLKVRGEKLRELQQNLINSGLKGVEYIEAMEAVKTEATKAGKEAVRDYTNQWDNAPAIDK